MITEEINRKETAEKTAEKSEEASGIAAEAETKAETVEETEIKTKDAKKQLKAVKAELEKIKKESEELSARLAEANDKHLRLAAEYENFRKRSQREREGVYADAYFDAIKALLPTIDNLERASQYTDPEKLADGMKLILSSVPETLKSLGVESFGDAGDAFDPNIHNAVMMVSAPEAEAGTVVNVLQRGYKRGEKVLRYAMVTVAEDA